MNRKEFEEVFNKVSDEVKKQIVSAMKYNESYITLIEKRENVHELIEKYEAKGHAVPETFIKTLQVMDKKIVQVEQVMEKMSKEIDKNIALLDKMKNYFMANAEKTVNEYLKEQENKLSEQEKELNKKINNLFKRK